MTNSQVEIRRGTYYDSIVLMQLQAALADLPDVTDVGVMMGTEANKTLLAQGNLSTPDVQAANNDDLIIEHWDVIAPFTPTPSGADPIAGESEVRDLERTESNKFRVNDFLKLAFVEAVDCFDDFIAGDLVQHSSRIDGGIDGWRRWQQAGVRYEFVLQVIGRGNFVASLSRIWIDGRDHAGFDLFRLDDGRIVEHWDCIEEIAPREQWANSGKF